MTSAELLLESISPRPRDFGAKRAFYPIVEPGFEAWGVLAVLASRTDHSAKPDRRRIQQALEHTTALHNPALSICYAGVDYGLYGQPHAVAKKSRSPVLTVVHKIPGQTLYNLFYDEKANAWNILAEIPQEEYTLLMLQLKLAKNEGHRADLEHSANIMLRNTDAPGPRLNLIDLGYNAGVINCLSNKPEYLIRLFFPTDKKWKLAETSAARETVLDKLLQGAVEAKMGTSNNRQYISATLSVISDYLPLPPSALTKAQKEKAVGMLCDLPIVQNTDRKQKPRLPKELKALGSFSLKDSADDLRRWLEAIHTSGTGRGIRD